MFKPEFKTELMVDGLEAMVREDNGRAAGGLDKLFNILVKLGVVLANKRVKV